MAQGKSTLTHARLQELLDYDPQTGIFTWKKPTGRRVKVGQIAGCDIGSGHLVIRIDTRAYCYHRLAWLYVTGEWPPQEIDHKDRNPGNNRFDNLRLATHAQNLKNQRKPKNNTSGFKGVKLDKRNGRWIARITMEYKDVHIGCFATAEEAAKAYDDAALKHFGEFAALNFEGDSGSQSLQ